MKLFDMLYNWIKQLMGKNIRPVGREESAQIQEEWNRKKELAKKYPLRQANND